MESWGNQCGTQAVSCSEIKSSRSWRLASCDFSGRVKSCGSIITKGSCLKEDALAPAWLCIACLDYHKPYHFQGSSNSRSLFDDCSGGSEFKIKVPSEASFPYGLSSWLANGSLLAFLSYGLSAVAYTTDVTLCLISFSRQQSDWLGPYLQT